eukprot:c15491_g1_i1.p1 GENE.c15491_g1_i1~~c15491_g1_i1.p1  ORF type:complete len:182 (+),score=53.92 c15491_g1_i1:71-547(+)
MFEHGEGFGPNEFPYFVQSEAAYRQLWYYHPNNYTTYIYFAVDPEENGTPDFSTLSKKYSANARFVVVDSQKVRETAHEYNTYNSNLYIATHDGVEVARLENPKNVDELEDFILENFAVEPEKEKKPPKTEEQLTQDEEEYLLSVKESIMMAARESRK